MGYDDYEDYNDYDDFDINVEQEGDNHYHSQGNVQEHRHEHWVPYPLAMGRSSYEIRRPSKKNISKSSQSFARLSDSRTSKSQEPYSYYSGGIHHYRLEWDEFGYPTPGSQRILDEQQRVHEAMRKKLTQSDLFQQELLILDERIKKWEEILASAKAQVKFAKERADKATTPKNIRKHTRFAESKQIEVERYKKQIEKLKAERVERIISYDKEARRDKIIQYSILGEIILVVLTLYVIGLFMM